MKKIDLISLNHELYSLMDDVISVGHAQLVWSLQCKLNRLIELQGFMINRSMPRIYY